MPPQPSAPVYASFPSDKLTVGAGVAIFHLATERVVVCYHSLEHHWFLPKGRRNANEDTGRGAEREGFEESGFRNRLLPLPMKHRQTQPDEGPQPFVVEPLWTQFLPLTRTAQYLLFWYAAETLPPAVEQAGGSMREPGGKIVYQPPIAYPGNMTLKERIAEDSIMGEDGKQKTYEPVRHEGTAADSDEAHYQSFLLPIHEAMEKLKGSVMEDVIRRGWDGIKLRMTMEERSTP